MIKNNPFKKLALMALGVLLALFLVELGFRAAGGLLLMRREAQNRRGIFKEGAYRILCLGESTTQGEWPPLLEKELNGQDRGITFKVIDEGRAGSFTGAILSRTKEYLDTFNPHMVVVMMGINDGEWVWENPVEYEDTTSFKLSLFLKNTRLNKLARYVIEGVKKPMISSPKTPGEYIREGNRYRENGEFEKAEKAYEAAIRTDPQNPQAYGELANLFRKNGQKIKLENLYEDRIKVDPKNNSTYLDLGYLYREIGEQENAAKVFEAAIKINPKNANAYLELGKIYRAKGETEKAERTYEAGIKADPTNPGTYNELGNLYRDNGDHNKAKKLYEAGIMVDPKNAHSYLELGKLHLMSGENEKAEDIFSKANKVMGGTPIMAGALSTLYLQQGKTNLQQEYRRTSYLPLTSSRNYQKLRDLVLKNNIKLVCMQYPMRDITALKQLLGMDKGIIYVENRDPFEEALKTKKLPDIFIDMFGGDFGHCTYEGNKIIAKNLSGVILKEVFGEK